MASFRHRNQVSNFNSSANICRGRSKAQVCLKKILRTISSCKPYENLIEAEETNKALFKRGFAIDLNLRLDAFSEIDESESPPRDVILYGDNTTSIEEKVEDVTEIKHGVCEEEITIELEKEEEEFMKREEDGVVETGSFHYKGDDGSFLNLLIEAARLISGEFEDTIPSQNVDELGSESSTHDNSHEKEETSRSKKRSHCWMVEYYKDFEDISPVVRSKRGRSQVLPYRFRDSVIEPWKRRSK